MKWNTFILSSVTSTECFLRRQYNTKENIVGTMGINIKIDPQIKEQTTQSDKQKMSAIIDKISSTEINTTLWCNISITSPSSWVDGATSGAKYASKAASKSFSFSFSINSTSSTAMATEHRTKKNCSDFFSVNLSKTAKMKYLNILLVII